MSFDWTSSTNNWADPAATDQTGTTDNTMNADSQEFNFATGEGEFNFATGGTDLNAATGGDFNFATGEGDFNFATGDGDFNFENTDGGTGDYGFQSYQAQSLPENAPELVAEKLQAQMKNIEFTKANIVEGSPWISSGFVSQLDLPDQLKKALYDLSVDRLSKIQKLVIPKLLMGKNIVAQSQSGTGKTITFLTAAFKKVNPELAEPQVLIVLPTFELAHQVCLVAEELGKNMPDVFIKRALRGERLGDEDLSEHIVIGTPGKVLDWMMFKSKIDGSKIKMLIFDEADELFDVNQNRDLMLLLKEKIDPEAQIVMFSATFTDEFCDFIGEFCPDAEILRLQQEEVALDNIKQLYVRVYNDTEKLSILIRVLRLADTGNCFIFTQTRDEADQVFAALKEEGYPVGLLSSNLEVEERKRYFDEFRAGTIRYLVATNVSARGIDIPNVCMVINYSLPFNPLVQGVDFDVYLHRIGRCGRFGKEGLALTFADRSNSEEQINELVNYFSKPIEELSLNDDLVMENQLTAN